MSKHACFRRQQPDAAPGGGLARCRRYQIRVEGCLDGTWSEWFDGLEVSADQERGETVIAGLVADQAALHGLLTKVRNLGLVLLGLCLLSDGQATGERSDRDG